MNGQIVELWGDAEVVFGDISLKADYIRLDKAVNEVFAKGRYDSTAKKMVGEPVFKDRSESYNTKEIRYNFNTKKSLVKGIITQQGDGNIRGKIVKKDADDNLYIRGSIYTTCNLATPHFHINAPRLKVVHNKQVVSGPFNLVINQIPLPIGLPFGFFPFPKKKDIGVSGILVPQYGEEPNGRGFYLRDGGYYWAVNENLGLQFTGQIYSRGSWGLGTSGAYNKRYRYAGNFQLRYNYNTSGALTAAEQLLNPPRTDFAISWAHAPQNIGRRSSFSANVNVTSNSYNQFNSFNTAAVTSNVAGSSIQYSRTFGKYVRAGSNIRVNQQFGQVNLQTGARENGKTDVGADFNLSVNQIAPFALKGGTSKWYESFRVGFQFDAQAQINNTIRSQLDTSGLGFLVLSPAGVTLRNREQIVRDSIFQAGQRRLGISIPDPNLISFNLANLSRILDNRNVTMRYSIPVSLPNFKIARYINFTPGFSLQGDIYSRQLTYTYLPNATDPTKGGVRIDTARGFFPTYSFATNASLNTRFYGTYFFRGKRLEAIRHTVAPSLSISYTPDFSGGAFGFFTVLPAQGSLAALPEYRRTLSRYRGLGGAYGNSPPGQSAVISFGIVNQLEMKVRSRDDTSGQEFKKIPLFDNISISGSYNLLAPEYKLSPINISANTQIFKNVNFNISSSVDPYAYRPYYNAFYNRYSNLTYLPENVVRQSPLESSTSYPRTNQYAIFAGQGLARLTSLQAFVSTRFAPKGADKPKKSPNATDATLRAINQNPDLYVDFNIPWTVNVSYSFGFTRLTPDQSAIVQSLQLTGDFSLTPKWKFTYQTGYDFQYHAPSITTIGVNRDLHCWEMAFNWTPYAGSASRAGNYSFDLRAKSSILQELKLSRRRSFFDSGGFGGGYR